MKKKPKPMFKLIIAYLVISFFMGLWPFEKGFISGTPSNGSYDKGYHDGYNGVSPSSYKNNYYDGWLEGDFDAECEYIKYSLQDREEFKNYECGSWSSY
jgi:hypothetical protein